MKQKKRLTNPAATNFNYFFYQTKKIIFFLYFRNSKGDSGMIPMSYVEEIPAEEYQEVPSDDSWSDNEDGKVKPEMKPEVTSERDSETTSAVSDRQHSDNQSQLSENKNNTLTNEYNGFYEF